MYPQHWYRNVQWEQELEPQRCQPGPSMLEHKGLSCCLFSAAALSCVTGAAAVIQVFGYKDRDVNISCSYEPGYETYEKYLCNLCKTTQAKTTKYSIYDDTKRQVFTTTISDLKFKDAGKYWCGVTRNGKDYYPGEVQLKVEPDSCCDHPTKIQSYEEDSVSISCSYESEYQSNLKYICRGEQPSICLQQALITSDNKQNTRFSLSDDNISSFTVTITDLTQNDSGSYLCGIHRNNNLDVYSAVELEVKEWCCVESNNLSGIVGQPLTVQCPYPPEHKGNTKFLCKGEHHRNCTHIVMGGRFTLRDHSHLSIFSVMVTELKAGDAGTYWCGSDSQWHPANYTRIQLSEVVLTMTEVPTIIRVETVEIISPQTTHIPDKPIKDATLLWSAVGLTVLLLILMVVLVIVCKYKCHKVKVAEVNTHRNIYKAADLEEVHNEAELYANNEAIVCAEKRTTRQQRNINRYKGEREDQHDFVYENHEMAESIYCNPI